MNYQKQRLVSQLRKDYKIVSEKNGELVSENAKLRQELDKLKLASGGENPELLQKLGAAEDGQRAAQEKTELLEKENKELRDHIALIEEKVKKTVDQGPKTGRRGKRSGPKL